MATIDPTALEALRVRARREVDEGLLPAVQWALALHGEIVAEEAYGDATVESRFAVFSATKPVVAAAAWHLIASGALDVAAPVASVIPEFATNGKDAVTIEQVMLHTSGFPHAPMGPPRWFTREGRLDVFARWRLNWEPGTQFEYHASSAHWVLAEVIERLADAPYAEVVERTVTAPLGLPRVLAIEPGDQDGIVDVVSVGAPPSAEELRALFGTDALPQTEVTPEALAGFNAPEVRALGVPGGGGLMRARDLALFHQGLLRNPGEIWDETVLTDARTNVRNRFLDPWFAALGVTAERTLGLVLAGDEAHRGHRGFAKTVSAATFGHNGAGGQIAWCDPTTGLSFGYCTNGLDEHRVRVARRGVALSSLAGLCVAG